MSDIKELKEEDLQQVTGGSISVKWEDKCHYNPSKWEYSDNAQYSSRQYNMCHDCKYNPHRNWAESTCEWKPKEDPEPFPGIKIKDQQFR